VDLVKFSCGTVKLTKIGFSCEIVTRPARPVARTMLPASTRPREPAVDRGADIGKARLRPGVLDLGLVARIEPALLHQRFC